MEQKRKMRKKTLAINMEPKKSHNVDHDLSVACDIIPYVAMEVSCIWLTMIMKLMKVRYAGYQKP
ncbi:hypothetical protein DERP_007661 [Dermatophagoides pteronyssinus]|uniref:Uncharacterized protein n=1 Tax=Dermatophagoides pteronyssinus TaxID=6956 RepID=A0ABQ8JKD4_DERPT|nr:hypothetical protein DERP_007661 [Dermatophagoides pteronyssinus]